MIKARKFPSAPWTLESALELIREIQPQIREMGYHLLLGGGVLNVGTSEKDLDLFFVPLNGTEADREPEEGPSIPPRTRLWHFLMALFGEGSTLSPLRDSPDYHAGEPWYWQGMYLGSYCGKRVDIFIR